MQLHKANRKRLFFRIVVRGDPAQNKKFVFRNPIYDYLRQQKVDPE